jgi:hypothetical protein
MFIRFFRNTNPFAFIHLPLITLILWSPSFVSQPAINNKHLSLLFDLCTFHLEGIRFVQLIISIILILTGAFLITYIINENEIIEKKSFLPALIYIVLMSNVDNMLTLNPILFANIFLLISISKVIQTYRKESAQSEIFDAAFYLSIASFFYFPCVILFPILVTGLIIYRSLNRRELIITLVGIILPYCFLLTYYFWIDGLADAINRLKVYFTFKEFPTFDLSQAGYFMLIIEGLIILFSLNKLIGNFINAAQRTKKNLLLFIWILIFVLGSCFISPELNLSYFSMLAIPLSVFIANYFLHMKKIWWGEIMFIVLIVTILLNDFSNYF